MVNSNRVCASRIHRARARNGVKIDVETDFHAIPGKFMESPARSC